MVILSCAGVLKKIGDRPRFSLYANADLGHAHDYLLPSVLRVLDGPANAGGGT